MSHVSTYRCDKCDSVQEASSLRLRRYVLGPDERLPVRASLAWCPTSNSLVAKELLPELAAIEAALDELEANGPSEEDKKEAKNRGADIAALVSNQKDLMRQVIAWLKGRQSPARCLACGSTEAAELPGQENGDPQEFVHPGCGGTFRFVSQNPIQDSNIELYTPEGLAWQAPAGLSLEECLDYFRRANSSPQSVPPWSEWWAENDKHASQVFPLVDYVRLKHRRLTGARQILQSRGELPKDFVPPSASETGSCEKCGDRTVEQTAAGETRQVCPRCDWPGNS